MFVFDVGQVFITAPSGQKFRVGTLTDVSVEIAVDGGAASTQFQLPVKFVGGKNTIKGKAGLAQFNGVLLGEMLFETATQAKGVRTGDDKTTIASDGLGGTVPLTPTLKAGFVFDSVLLASYCDTGEMLTLTSGTPGVGQFKVVGSTVVFAVGDIGKAVKVTSLSTSASLGKTYEVANTYQGILPTFELYLIATRGDQQIFAHFYTCVSENLTLSLALEDWATQKFSFQVQSNGTLQVGVISLT